MPILPGIGQANRPPILNDVGKDHHLRMSGFLERAGDMHLQLAELTAECHLCCRIKRLLREADHAVIGQRLQHETQLRLAERLREIHAVNGAAECLTRWFYLVHHPYCPSSDTRRGASVVVVTT